MCSSAIFVSRCLAFARRVDDLIGIHEFGEVRERRVLANGHAEHETLRLAVFGDERDAGVDTVLRFADAHPRAVDRNVAAVRNVGSGNRAHDLGAPRTDQTGQTDDLARAHRE